MGGVPAPPKTLAALALTAAVVAGCGSGSGSDSAAPGGAASSGTTSAGSALELRPVFARYAEGVSLGGGGVVRLGPQVPDALVGAMKGFDCSSPPTQLQGMLMECDAARTVYLLKAPIVSGDVESATAKQIGHQNLWFVEVHYDQTAADAVAKADSTMPGTEIAFALPGRVLTAPVINSSMSDGSVGITGDYDHRQAEKLATQIAAN